MRIFLPIVCAFAAMTLPVTGQAEVVGFAYLNSDASTNAAIGFVHGAPDVVFTVPSPVNAACTGQLDGDTLCFQTEDSDNTTLGQFLASGGANILSGSPAALSAALDNTGFEFTGSVSVKMGQVFQAGHDDGIQLLIGTSLVIDAPSPTSLIETPAVYTGPDGTYSFDLVYGECCGGPADLAISIPLDGVDDVISSVPEPRSLIILATALLGLCAHRERCRSER